MRFVLAAALLVACTDARTQELTAIRDQVCACKSAECAERAIATVPQTDVTSTPKTQALANAMLDCLAKLYRAEQAEIDASEQHDHGSGHDHADTDTDADAEPARTGSAGSGS